MLRWNLRPVNSLTFVSGGPYGVNLDVFLITGCWSCQPWFKVGFEEAKANKIRSHHPGGYEPL